MVSISDILKILDQTPVWKTLKAMPARIDALEKRIADLEKRLDAPTRQPGEPCKACGALALRRTSSRQSDSPLGILGARDEVWTCTSCGAEDKRNAIS